MQIYYIIISVASKMFRAPTVSIFREVFYEGNSRWTKNIRGYAKYNQFTKLYMHFLVISHMKSSEHGQESFKIYS